jgi:hypothetical protein
VNRFLLLCAAFVCIIGCSSWLNREVELKRFPIDSLDGIITQSGVQIDKQISSDGHGSLRINITEPKTIHLFEIRDVDVENAKLIYRAQVRTENLNGQIHLEIRCHFPDKEELFSRKRLTQMTGTKDWTKQEAVFFLGKGIKPDNLKLNLVINGTGTVWIDDVRLLKGPLRKK